jgi:hypothetical protein
MCTPNLINTLGNKPEQVQWTVTRGDTSFLKIDFLDLDETTHWNTDGWEYSATSYDPQGDVLDSLTVTPYEGYLIISVPASVTGYWGTKYSNVVADLAFDVQVKIPVEDEFIIWTPVIGTIRVLGNVTPGALL